jgi:hypothetical protein
VQQAPRARTVVQALADVLQRDEGPALEAPQELDLPSHACVVQEAFGALEVAAALLHHAPVGLARRHGRQVVAHLGARQRVAEQLAPARDVAAVHLEHAHAHRAHEDRAPLAELACHPGSNGLTGLHWDAGVRFLERCSPTFRTELQRAAGERCVVAQDSRSGLWGAQERARKALVHANKVTERAKRALRVAAARERSAARHDRHAETLEAHGAKRAAAAERRDARLDRAAADAERERQRVDQQGAS